MNANRPTLNANEVLKWLRGVIKDLEQPTGEMQTRMEVAAKGSSEEVAMAASGLVQQRKGKLFHAIRNSYRVTREFGDMTIIIHDEKMMDSFIPPTRNPYVGTLYRPYWRLLMEGWGQGGYYNLALIYNHVDGSLIRTSPFFPGALNPSPHERVTFVRHPGCPARDWLKLSIYPVTKEIEKEAILALHHIFFEKNY